MSTLDQKTDRQRVNESEYSQVFEDKCSGAVPFFDRPAGQEIQCQVEEGVITSLSVWSIDRLGRDFRDIINTIHYFTERKIGINFISQGLTTLDQSGKETPISKMIISILAIVGEMERVQIRERQLEGVRIAKLKGVYKGRAAGSHEDTLAFLSKPANAKALELLKKGYKCTEIAKITGLHINTLTKIKKLGLPKPE